MTGPIDLASGRASAQMEATRMTIGDTELPLPFHATDEDDEDEEDEENEDEAWDEEDDEDEDEEWDDEDDEDEDDEDAPE